MEAILDFRLECISYFFLSTSRPDTSYRFVSISLLVQEKKLKIDFQMAAILDI